MCFCQAGRIVDPPPAIGAPPRSFVAQAIDKYKTYWCLSQLNSAKPSVGWSSNLFPVEAERIFSAATSAVQNGDKSELRDLVTENYYSTLKRQMPEKKRGAPKVVVATSGASIVQARRIQLTR